MPALTKSQRADILQQADELARRDMRFPDCLGFTRSGMLELSVRHGRPVLDKDDGSGSYKDKVWIRGKWLLNPHLKILKGHSQKMVCVDMSGTICSTCIDHFVRAVVRSFDLGKWLTGDYAIPSHETMEDSDVETLLAAHESQQATQADDDS